MQDDRVKRMFEEKEATQDKARMVKPPQVEPNTQCVLQHPRTKYQDLVPMMNRTQQKRLQRKFTLWNEFSNLKKEEAEKEIMYGEASKPKLRFDRHSKSDDVTTSEESAIKAKVKELEKAMSIDEEDIAMGDS